MFEVDRVDDPHDPQHRFRFLSDAGQGMRTYNSKKFETQKI